jgi:hypothetical protein
MPLIKSASRKAIGKNIKTEMKHGKAHNVAVAIALDTARRAGGTIHRRKFHKPSRTAMGG